MYLLSLCNGWVLPWLYYAFCYCSCNCLKWARNVDSTSNTPTYSSSLNVSSLAMESIHKKQWRKWLSTEHSSNSTTSPPGGSPWMAAATTNLVQYGCLFDVSTLEYLLSSFCYFYGENTHLSISPQKQPWHWFQHVLIPLPCKSFCQAVKFPLALSE